MGTKENDTLLAGDARHTDVVCMLEEFTA